MKLLNTFIALICFNLSIGQIVDMRNQEMPYISNRDSQEGDYYKDIHDDLDKFEGTWLYDDGSDKVEVIIIKYEHILLSRSGGKIIYIDKLGVEFKYWHNGVLVKETDPFFPSGDQIEIEFIHKPILYPIGATPTIDSGYSRVRGWYDEPFILDPLVPCKQANPTELELGYQTTINNVNGTITTGSLHWKIIDLYESIGYPLTDNLYHFTCKFEYVLPRDMILIKQP